jgi:hypothetical protein
MKTLKTAALLAFYSLLLVSCKKDDVTPPEPPVANAGSDQNIQLPASSFTLSGSGTTPQGSIKNYTWTRVSGPDNPLINNASSATTSVSGFSAGTYLFQLQVTNDAGLSATDEVTITVIGESQSAPIGSAGADQTVHLPESFFVLSGSGTTQKGTITDYGWTQVSGPNISTINNATSATTSVSGFVAGTYLYQLQVTNSFGLTAKDTIVINVIGLQTLTLQPSNNNDEKHLLGNNSGYDQSVHATEIDASAWTISGVTVYLRGLVKFDLSSIPANATIVSAKLSLYSNPTPLNGDLVHANSGTDNSMFIRRVTNSWDPQTANWSNQPSTTPTDQVSIPHTSQPFLDLIDIDVKNLVVAMKTSGNYGFMIMLQNEVIYNIRDFCSSTYSDASKHPKLVITYQ